MQLGNNGGNLILQDDHHAQVDVVTYTAEDAGSETATSASAAEIARSSRRVPYLQRRKPRVTPPVVYAPTMSPLSLIPSALVDVAPGTSMVEYTSWLSQKAMRDAVARELADNFSLGVLCRAHPCCWRQERRRS